MKMGKKWMKWLVTTSVLCASFGVLPAKAEETFAVSNGNSVRRYSMGHNNTEHRIYTFGSSFLQMKEFNTSSLPETKAGDSGISVLTDSSNYNNVAIMDAQTKTGTGYYPLGNDLSENGFYLFFGSGGNSDVSASVKFDAPVASGKYIKITYAKPTSTNNGSTNRSAGNSNTMAIGREMIDVQDICEFDKWYTTTVRVSEEVSGIDIKLGKWSSTAISEIEILDSANVLEITAEDDISEKYITSEIQTVRYKANVYNSITTEMGRTEIIAKGTADETAQIAYSVNGYSGVSISWEGLLCVTPEALEGTVTVSAEYGEIKASLPLQLKELGGATAVEIYGDEVVAAGTAQYKAIPVSDGVALPARDTKWEIMGETNGASISQDGLLIVPQSAKPGVIKIRAALTVSDIQSTETAGEFAVTIRRDASKQCPLEIKGLLFRNGETDVTKADGTDGIIIEKVADADDEYNVTVKVFDNDEKLIAAKTDSVAVLPYGVSSCDFKLAFTKAAFVKAYVTERATGAVVSERVFRTQKGEYSNIPLVADWITGAKSGLGMGAGIIAPDTAIAPYGIDPSLTNLSALNVNYEYGDDYQGAEEDNVLWYKTGAYLASANGANNSIYARDGADWEQQALPIGNGYMGGMLFGLADKDQIQINEETFWAAGYRGTQTEVAADTVNKNMSEGINGFMSVGNIFVDFHMPKGASVKNYYRDLNLNEAVAHVRYEYDGKKFAREYLASYPKEALAFRYTGDELNFDVKPVLMHPGKVTVRNGEIKITGKLKDSEPYSSGGNAVWNQESDLEYCTIIKVIADDGTVLDGYNSVSVAGSTGVTVLVAAATDYDKDQFTLNANGSVNMEKTPYKSERGVLAAIEKAEKRINGASAISYEQLKAEHIADYKAQFDTVLFTLTDDSEVCGTPTDELQDSYRKVVGVREADGKTVVSYDETAYANLDRHLEELHYNYARYMMISSSRSKTMPATLQGKWCQSTAEIWGSCYCININMEMNYWFAGGANLTDSAKALISWLTSQIPAGRVTAKNMYKVRPKSYTFADGKITFSDSAEDRDDVFIMHTKQSIMGTTDLTGSKSIQSAGNTAWLMYNLWDIYQTTGDKEMLAEEIYPIMRKAANFYTQYLYVYQRKVTSDTEKYPDGYFYTSWEGRSPEHGPTQEGIKYDLQLIAGMYDDTIRAAEILGQDADKVAAWKEIRNHMELPVELGEDGQIKEWEQETGYNTHRDGGALGDPVHRHISHLVGLYPGTLINRDTEELMEGAKIVLTNRGDDSTGWSCSNKFLLWGRALEGDKALELFRYQLAQKTYANLFDTHAPFQIDGNFGSAAGVMELLMQSQTGPIYILPALPKAWDKGEIKGIKAKNGAEVSIRWDERQAVSFTVIPVSDGDLTIGYEKDNGVFFLQGAPYDGVYADFGEDHLYTIPNARAGRLYTFTKTQKPDKPQEPEEPGEPDKPQEPEEPGDSGSSGGTGITGDSGSGGGTGTTGDSGIDGVTGGQAIDISKAADIRTALKKTSYVYSGKQIKPGVTVSAGGQSLKKNTDYNVVYKNNTKVGKASVTITGIGNYAGTIIKTFNIVPKGTTISGKLTARAKGFSVQWKKQTESVTGYELQYSTSKKYTKKATVTKRIKKANTTKLKVDKLKAGRKYYVRIRTYQKVKGTYYYSKWSADKNITTKK